MLGYRFVTMSAQPRPSSESDLLPYAHSANHEGERHLLTDHLRTVAERAGGFASRFGGEEIAFLAGLWHDVGKADPAWQRRLIECERGERRRIGLDHKCAGALLAERLGQVPIGLLIHAHHGGLKHPTADFAPWFQETRNLPGPQRAIEALTSIMPDLADIEAAQAPAHASDPLGAELFLRMSYSALVDADSLDTEDHSLGRAATARVAPQPSMLELWDRYQAFLGQQSPDLRGAVNQVRREVHEACVSTAPESPGVFRLTVPTGGGKTRSVMAFALRHAIAHGLRRVIVAVPFTTITQQTADVYRNIFGDDRIVLEHHSAAGDGTGQARGEEDGFDDHAVWQRLAAENWDAPIVVTTTVQLFESLFSNRRAKTRKLHNLAGSVIILDEAQSLPAGLLSPILDVLGRLAKDYGASVVLCTATQPAFEMIPEFKHVAAREIVPSHATHFDAMRRVTYDWRTDQPHQWRDVASWIRRERRALVIVNTKRHALELLEALDDPHALHLSSLLCGAHRNEVLAEIRSRLDAGQRCTVVSTQVVEAGVDLDFDVVFRAEAPLDAMIQAAGRCNREGRLGTAGGRVVVFRPPDDAAPPGIYRSGRDVARLVRQLHGSDLDDPTTVRRYFELLLASAVDSDQREVQVARQALDFPEVAQRFRMIDADACDVIVDYPAHQATTIERLTEQLSSRQRPARESLHELQPYTVSLSREAFAQFERDGFVERIPHWDGLARWRGQYDQIRGIVAADPELII
ncbi:MAG: CRISPR-associated helicase Cas3' [Chloroflexi bacterium]|nr:CRISPR-associated helicase Cas3' [Chloroflexota bacterium]